MKIFFIVPWPAASALACATALPNLALLCADDRVTQVRYFTPEAVAGIMPQTEPKLLHQPVVSPAGGGLSGYARRYAAMRRAVLGTARRDRPDLVICRGAPAGIFGHLLHRHFKVPYVVESFEPHADYMVQSGTWHPLGIKCLIQRVWERMVMRSAHALITVSQGYADYLASRHGVFRERLMTVPCGVDLTTFRPAPDARATLRARLGIGDACCVVYLGKFGGIYHDVSVLRTLAVLREAVDDLHVLLLTPDDPEPARNILRAEGFADRRVSVLSVPHSRVADHLAAADIAVSFINSGPWSFACSPIKHGEYWAAGLPVLMPAGIGDESRWLLARGAGAFVDFARPETLRQAFASLRKELDDPDRGSRLRDLVREERSSVIAADAYDRLLAGIAGAG